VSHRKGAVLAEETSEFQIVDAGLFSAPPTDSDRLRFVPQKKMRLGNSCSKVIVHRLLGSHCWCFPRAICFTFPSKSADCLYRVSRDRQLLQFHHRSVSLFDAGLPNLPVLWYRRNDVRDRNFLPSIQPPFPPRSRRRVLPLLLSRTLEGNRLARTIGGT